MFVVSKCAAIHSWLAKQAILIVYAVQENMFRKQRKRFVGAEGNRSDSDDGSYVAFVESAVADDSIFGRFRRDKIYCETLEHASFEDGLACLEIIKRKAPNFLDLIDRVRDNDLIGSPLVYEYAKYGTLGTTTLRYLKVAADLFSLFGDAPGRRIVEIGVGYGGQLLVSDRLFTIDLYELIDLPPVLDLTAKYLESHVLNCGYQTSTLNQKTGKEVYDLAISNYAFSELPGHIQRKYIDKILISSKRGYLTMNSGLGKTDRSKGKLSLDDLRNSLPPFEVLPEEPLTGPENYIIAWGHQPA